jgi:drug/metabolite transporter (DMT)-like permease
MGVLIVIRPGLDGFDLAALWPVLAVLGLSVRDICTRAAPAGLPTPLLAAWSYGAIMILGLAMTAMDGWVWPTATQTGALAVIVACGMVGIWLLTAATRVGDMGAIMPFRYSRLVVALALGLWLFGEKPDAVTWAGMGLIIGAGLYTFLRERALSKAARPR